jgi:hypothetical protein
MLEEARESGDEGHRPAVRVDRRSGKPTVQRDDAFWREHERRRVELGQSARQYCAANGLALSTYRLRVNGKKRAGGKPSDAPRSMSPTFVAVTSPGDAAATIEITLEGGMMMRLCGSAAERVLARVMERLA